MLTKSVEEIQSSGFGRICLRIECTDIEIFKIGVRGATSYDQLLLTIGRI